MGTLIMTAYACFFAFSCCFDLFFCTAPAMDAEVHDELCSLQVNNAAQQAVSVTSSIQPLSDAIAAGAVAMFRYFHDRFSTKLQLYPPQIICLTEVKQREVWQQCALRKDGRSVPRTVRRHTCRVD